MSLLLLQVFDSGGELNDGPPTMFHPQRQLLRTASDHDSAAASASPAPALPATTNAALPFRDRLPSSPPALSSYNSPLPASISSALPPSNPQSQHSPPLQQQHRAVQMQLVRSSGNITVMSAAASVSSSNNAKTGSVHTGPNISSTTSANDAAAASAEQMMAKLQVQRCALSLWLSCLCTFNVSWSSTLVWKLNGRCSQSR